ncbi:GIY-YIG nuclease family protein [Roseomonas sp. GC11]|uniref:GIY-YIG nuclease family protein n=1 Tax=Roseomonas sp. GC11 TaxID=2950546 RepID=UPI00210F037D|nr:GIY-YIG nuclease family protein [Roseomonas sp. GC11]MCQ4162771.1 GIY-YIG nuclease family protein [Roseomonas sp. GC11]
MVNRWQEDGAEGAPEDSARPSVDVYLIAQLREEHRLFMSFAAPGDTFKIGYSADPFQRLKLLRSASAKNLALFGVLLCANETTARDAEQECHGLLQDMRWRGEWFRGSVADAWARIAARFTQAVWLTDGYRVDLDKMKLVPFAMGAWGGISDNFHHYRAFKRAQTSPLDAATPWPRQPLPDTLSDQ